ncbi:MAG: PorV/PorQ family protein [Candidatus Saganbacteria bacterium]|nr:PorV/PorQ family protein [Candidatus Saganbacteria bacterium]
MFGFLPSASAQAFDPLSVAGGARSIALGGAFTAVADDANVVFNNPAGLGEIEKIKFTTLGGTLLEDVSYTALGGTMSLGDKFSVGAGFAGAFTSGLALYDHQGQLTGSASYGNSVILVALGKKFTDRLSLGLTLKYFASTGAVSDADNGRGFNADLGLLQSGWNWLKFGLVGQNIFGGGRINYPSGASEPLPLTIKAGIKANLTGGRFDSAWLAPVETSLVADALFSPAGPAAARLRGGLEFSPHPYLTLRAGLDGNNPTAGLGLKVAGVGFNYAYHAYGEPFGSAVYFALSYDEQDFPPPEEVPDVYLANNQITNNK